VDAIDAKSRIEVGHYSERQVDTSAVYAKAAILVIPRTEGVEGACRLDLTPGDAATSR